MTTTQLPKWTEQDALALFAPDMPLDGPITREDMRQILRVMDAASALIATRIDSPEPLLIADLQFTDQDALQLLNSIEQREWQQCEIDQARADLKEVQRALVRKLTRQEAA